MTEGIMPAIESAHALAGALELGRELGPEAVVLVSLSGRGDKDVDTASRWFGLVGDDPARADLTALRDLARTAAPAAPEESR
jgi:tryptophan synthase beta chain